MSGMTATTYPFLNSSKFLIPLSLTAILPNLAPLIWHIRSRNVSTSSILLWVTILNLINLINATTWHNDDLVNWFRGYCLCDIELRLIVGAGYGGLPGAAFCLAQSLARMLDVENQKTIAVRRQWVKEALLCWGLPIWMMVVYYAVQPIRYTITAGYGCSPPFSNSWVSVVLLFMWPVLLMIPTCCYTILMTYRMCVYHSQVFSCLARSRTSQSRFRRLLVLSSLLTVVILGSSVVQLWYFLRPGLESYSWKEVHAGWNYARLKPSGEVNAEGNHSDRWLWVAFGYCSFLTLGMGYEVQAQYRSAIAKVSMKRWLPSSDEARAMGRTRLCFPSLGSRVTVIFGRKRSKDLETTESSVSLGSPQVSRFSKTYTTSARSKILLPISEPKPIALSCPGAWKSGKWSLISRLPSWGQAFAGVPPATVIHGHQNSRNGASQREITLPSPIMQGFSDELILKMVGAEPVRK